jgi:predicted O-methyltransferase YrrM
MADWLTPSSRALEFGAGYSTRWIADRCGHLVSVETSPQWWSVARDTLQDCECDWDVQLVKHPAETKLSRAVDLVLVDCAESLRFDAVKVGWRWLKPGGWLLFDDAQRIKHRGSVNLLNTFADSVVLGWDDRYDIPEARKRLALAWRKAP